MKKGPFFFKNEKQEFVPISECTECGFYSDKSGCPNCIMLTCPFFFFEEEDKSVEGGTSPDLIKTEAD